MKRIIESLTPPENTQVMWLDVSDKIKQLKVYINGEWVVVNDDTNITNTIYKHVAQQVTDGAWIPVKAGRNSEGNIIEGAVSEGEATITDAKYAHAEGLRTNAGGMYSHAEGDNTAALNKSSHAEGQSTTAASNGSHAEGFLTKASGSYSHSEGYETKALGFCSHVEGYDVSVKGNYSHAEGIYNYDSNDFIKVLGVGSKNDRVNAEVVYVKRGENGVPISSDPKNGYKYIIGIGGYTGKAITESMKSIQEVISDLESRIATLEEKLKS